jgi:hypothetical protein
LGGSLFPSNRLKNDINPSVFVDTLDGGARFLVGPQMTPQMTQMTPQMPQMTQIKGGPNAPSL